jgi:hypothetical protein
MQSSSKDENIFSFCGAVAMEPLKIYTKIIPAQDLQADLKT